MKRPRLDSYKKYHVGDKFISKACNLKFQILYFEYDIFGVYVVVKVIDSFKLSMHYYGKVIHYDISILNEYKLLKK